MLQLVINNQEIDLAPGEQIILSKAIGRIGDFSNREGLFTEDFEINWTAKNIEIIGFNEKTTASSRFPYTIQDAILKQRGVELSRGFVQLTKVNGIKRTASVSFFGDNANWFSLLGNDSIRDLDLFDLNHNWTEANIVASWSNTEGYVYPFCDPGTFDAKATNTTDVTDWYPAVFRKTLIERIFDRIGFKLSGSFLNRWAYKNAIIPVVRMIDSANTNNYAYGRSSETQIFAGEATVTQAGTEKATLRIGTTNSGSDFDTTNEVFVSSTTGDVSLTFTGNFLVTKWENSTFGGVPLAGVQMEVFLDFLKNGVIQESILINFSADAYDPPAYGFAYTLDETRIFSVVPSDEIGMQIRFEWDGFRSPVKNQIAVYSITNYQIQTQDIEIDSDLASGQEVDVAYQLPDISQRDFVREMIVMHALQVDTDNYTKTVSFTPAQEVLGKLTTAPDWSNKVDFLREGDVDFVEVVQGYGRQTFFRWTADDDDFQAAQYKLLNEKQYGRGLVQIENDFLEPQYTFWESVFSPTLTPKTWTNASLPGTYIPFIQRVDSDGDRIEATPRILFYVGNTTISEFSFGITSVDIDVTNYTSVGWAYFDKPSLSENLNKYKEALSWQTPDLANPSTTGLLDNYYTRIIRIWNRPRYVTVSMRLNEYEYQTLDFLQPVFLDTEFVRGYFVIDEIEDYDGELATVNLIQVE